jgi:hypothetical protein
MAMRLIDNRIGGQRHSFRHAAIDRVDDLDRATAIKQVVLTAE